jgi:hypothetical protein
MFKDIYHKRWSVEEYFKYIKRSMNLNEIDEKSMESLMKTIYCYLIISTLVRALINVYGPCKDTKTIINKCVLTKAVYDDFVMRLFYNTKMGDKSIRSFLDKAIQLERTNVGTSRERVSARPYSKWYIKRYYRKYLIDGNGKLDKKGHSKLELKKLEAKI